MDVKRAQEILSSPNNIEVLYHGELVWLQDTSDDLGKINVKSLDTNKQMNVALGDLKETGKVKPSVSH